MIFTYTLPLKMNFEDRRNRGDIGWDGPRLTSFPVAFRISLHWSGVAAKRGWVLLGDDNFLHEKMSANMEDLNQESPDIVLLDSRTPLVLYHKVRSWEVWLIQHQLPKPCHLIPGLHMCSADASAASDALQCWCTWHAGPGITTQLWEAEGYCNYLFFVEKLSTVVWRSFASNLPCLKLTANALKNWLSQKEIFIFKALIFRGYNC